MKSVVVQSGQLYIKEVPLPEIKRNFLLVKTDYSAISPGTELLMIHRSRELVNPLRIGYSATGLVTEVGEGVTHLNVGDRVACYGGPYVHHAEYLLVPKHLAVLVPSHVNPKEAALVGLGAIAIHALRQADLRFGEHVVVIGLGVLGQIVAQIAHAAAFNVIAYDLLDERRHILEDIGIRTVCHSMDEIGVTVNKQTDGTGVDSVLLCAKGKKTGLIDQALKWIRDRGNVVIVGDLEIELSRELMFKKEAQLLISRAGGPGRYDTAYEREGNPYPIGFIRWTERNNMAEYIRLLSEGRLNIAPIITETVPIREVNRVYRSFVENPEKTLGVLIEY